MNEYTARVLIGNYNAERSDVKQTPAKRTCGSCFFDIPTVHQFRSDYMRHTAVAVECRLPLQGSKLIDEPLPLVVAIDANNFPKSAVVRRYLDCVLTRQPKEAMDKYLGPSLVYHTHFSCSLCACMYI